MGYFHVYSEKDGKVIADYGKIPNHFVDAGKIAFLDTMMNSTQWSANNHIYLGVGSSTNTNAGVDGPTALVPVSNTGLWQGPDDADWKLTTEVTLNARPQMICYRSGKTCYLKARITNAECAAGALSEFGIFLGSDITKPTANPVTIAAATDRTNALIIRAVRFLLQGAQYLYNPLTKVVDQDLIFEYIFGDFS
jgi:hypothetical protein